MATRPYAASSVPSVSHRDVDLDVSRTSQSSHSSFVTLGGHEYPVGSKIGKTGLFIIGDPDKHLKKDDSFQSTVPSVTGSQVAIAQPNYPVLEKGYNFEYWNWTAIRFGCLIGALAIMIALLAATIGVAVKHKAKCELSFDWWKGSVFYHIPITAYTDDDNNNLGDFVGLQKKAAYIKYLGVSAVVLSNFLMSDLSSWDHVKSYHDIDERLGSISDFDGVIKEMHDDNIKVILQWPFASTSVNHPWFKESRDNGPTTSNFYDDFYIWVDQPSSSAEYESCSWKSERIRSQYYCYHNQTDSSLALLDFTNLRVQTAMLDEMQFWLKRGVDGFDLVDLDRIHATGANTVGDIMKKMSELVQQYEKDEPKILIADQMYLDYINRTYRNLATQMVDSLGLVRSQLTFPATNSTYALTYGTVSNALQWQNETSVYTLWNMVQMSMIPPENVAVFELFMLMLPGTPSITAGQEIAWYNLEVDIRDRKPMLWKADTVFPYNPGSFLNETTIGALQAVIMERKSAYALRMTHPDLPENMPGPMPINMKVSYIDNYVIVIERYFKRKDSYFFIGNFGPKSQDKDWSEIVSPWGDVIADTHGANRGKLDTSRLILHSGQGLVFKVAT